MNEACQKYFDDVVAHLLKQGKRAMLSKSKACAYRGADGTTCAAGCKIPDEHYRVGMEGNPIRVVVEDMYPLVKPFFPDLDLATDLQRVHDMGYNCLANLDICYGKVPDMPDEERERLIVEAWPFLLCQVAKKYNLTIPQTLQGAA